YSATSGDSLSPALIGGLVQGGIYRVHVVNSTTIQLKRNDVLTTQVNYLRAGGGDQIIRTDGLSWTDSGFGVTPSETLLITGSSVNKGTWPVSSAAGATLTPPEANSVTATQVSPTTQFAVVTHTCSTSGCTPPPDTYEIRRSPSSPVDWSLNTNLVGSGSIIVTGAGANNGTYTVTGLSGNVFTVSQTVTNATTTANVSKPVTSTFDEPIVALAPKKSGFSTTVSFGGAASDTTFDRIGGGDWTNLGYATGATLAISNDGANNGTYKILASSTNTTLHAARISTTANTDTVAGGVRGAITAAPVSGTPPSQTLGHNITNDLHAILRTGDVPLSYTNLGGGTLVSGNTY